MAGLFGRRHAVKRIICPLAVAIQPWIAKVVTPLASVVHVPGEVLPGTGECAGQIGNEEVLDPADENFEGNRLKIFLHRIPHLMIGGDATLIFDLSAGSHQT